MRVGNAGRAGRYAQWRYRTLLRRWRRRVLGRLLLLALPFFLVGIALSTFTDSGWRWSGGVVLGLGLGILVIALQTPPRHIENWILGAIGERRTERALKALVRSGWIAIHDLDWPGAGNLDHLVIGPGGVYVLDSKAWSGVVSVDAGGVTTTSKDDPEDVRTRRHQRRQGTAAGSAVARALAGRSGLQVPAPAAVVVVWAPFPQRVVHAGGSTYVAGDHLADWLISQPRRLTRDQITRLAAAASGDLLSTSIEARPARHVGQVG